MSWELRYNPDWEHGFTDAEITLLFVLYCSSYAHLEDKLGLPTYVLEKLQKVAEEAITREGIGK